MKKLVLFSILTLLFLSACGGNKKSEEKLFVYNWSYYIPDEVIKGFEEEYKIKVVYDVYSSNEEMYAKIKGGATGYDLTFPSSDYAQIMISQDMLVKIDKSKIPNLKYITENTKRKMFYDRNMDFTVPYVSGAVGIGVNTKYVKNYPRDFSIFEMSEYKGKMTLLNDVREVLGAALIVLGYSPETTNIKELEKAQNLATKWKRNVLKFDSESFGKLFASEEVWISHGYLENIMEELTDEQKENFDYFVPTGSSIYIDSMVILKGGKNTENAYKFINYIHRPEVYAKISDFLGYPPLNSEAAKFMKEKLRLNSDDINRGNIIKDLGENLELHNKYWQDVLMSE